MKIKNIILVLTLLLPAFACKKFSGSGSLEEAYNGKIDVAISVSVPGHTTENVVTKAFTDSDIKNMDVLVFDENGRFFRRVKVSADSLTVTASGAKLIIRLPATAKKRILHIVANGRTADGATDRLNFNSIALNTPEANAIGGLVASAPNAMSGVSAWTDKVMPLVMWSRVEFNGITLNSKKEGVKLLRSTAAVQVKKGAVTASNGLNDFTVLGITLSGGAKSGRLAPNPPTGSVAVPNSTNPTGDKSLSAQNAWVMGEIPTQYVYERNCVHNDYMGVIVKAKYKGVDSYYKIQMKNNGGVLNIVRNHRYIITITEVNGPGHISLENAIQYAPSNALKVDVRDEDDGFTGVVADADSYMSVSNTEFALMSRNGASVGNTVIATVYSSRGITPSVSATPSSGLTNLQISSIGGNKYSIKGNFVASAVPFNCVLNIRCGNLSQNINVVWVKKFNWPVSPVSLKTLLSATDYEEAYVLNPSSTSWLRLKKTSSSTDKYDFLRRSVSPDAFVEVENMNTGDNTGTIITSIVKNDKRVSCRLVVVK